MRHAQTSAVLTAAILPLFVCACGGGTTAPTQPSPALRAVYGEVRGLSSLPLTGAQVLIADGLHAGRSVTTDQAGQYRIDGVSGGMTLTATSQGYDPSSQSVQVTTQDLRLDFRLSAQAATLLGRVTDGVDGNPVGGARIEVPNTTDALSAPDGFFVLPFPVSTETVVRFSRDGYWTRLTGARPGSEKLGDADLLPAGKGFDLTFFDYVFRKQWGGTVRWVVPPIVELWTKEFTCEEGNGPYVLCNRIRATEADAPISFVQNVHAVMAADAGEYTGGAIGSDLVTRAHEPGTVLSASVSENVISFAYVRSGLQWPQGSGVTYRWRGQNGGTLIGAHIQVHDADRNDRSVVSHEFAHALGFFHPDGYDAVPLPSNMKSRIYDRPTSADRLHGRILYRRPPGNRSPDEDPPGAVINFRSAPVHVAVVR